MNRNHEDTCMIDHACYAHNLSSCKIKTWKKFRLNGIPVQACFLFDALILQLFTCKLQMYAHNWDDQSYLHIILCGSYM